MSIGRAPRPTRGQGAPDHETAARDRARILIIGGALTALFALAIVAFTAVFAADAWMPRALGIASGTLLAAAGIRALATNGTSRHSGAIISTLVGVMLGTAIWATPIVLSGRLRVWLELPGALLQQVSLELTVGAAPVRPSPELGDLICTAVLIVAAVVTLLFALRASLLSGILIATLLLATPLVTTRGIDPLTLALAGLLLAVIVWAATPAPRWGGLVAAGVAVAVAAGAVAIAPPTRDRVWNSANLTAPVGSNTPDVSLALADDLRERSNTPAFSFVADDRAPIRFTLATVSDFSGGRWQPQDALTDDRLDVGEARDPAQVPPQLAESDADDDAVTVRITIDGLVSEWLPLPQSTSVVGTARAESFETEQWLWLDEAAASRSDRSATQRGDAYVARYTPLDRFPVSPRPEGGRNAANALPLPPATSEPRYTDPAAAPDEVQQYLELPGEVPQSIRDTAERVRSNAGTDDRLVIAETIERWFRSGEFAYNESAPVAPGSDADDPYAIMETFLDSRSGFCVHYASTFGVLARELGLPTRVAVGYAARAESSEQTTVRGRDLHAWPEVYVSDEGWVPFEPTPGGAGFRADTGEDVAATPGTEDAQEDGGEATPDAQPTPEETEEPAEEETVAPEDDDAATAASSATDGSPWATWSAAVLGALLLILLAPAGTRQVIGAVRRTRMRSARAPAAAAWHEFRARARDLGAGHPHRTNGTARPRARTPEAWVEHLVASGALTDRSAIDAAWSLATAVTAERYGTGGTDPSTLSGLPQQCATATAELTRTSTRAHRIRAALAPVSLVRRREDRPPTR